MCKAKSSVMLQSFFFWEPEDVNNGTFDLVCHLILNNLHCVNRRINRLLSDMISPRLVCKIGIILRVLYTWLEKYQRYETYN